MPYSHSVHVGSTQLSFCLEMLIKSPLQILAATVSDDTVTHNLDYT